VLRDQEALAGFPQSGLQPGVKADPAHGLLVVDGELVERYAAQCHGGAYFLSRGRYVQRPVNVRLATRPSISLALRLVSTGVLPWVGAIDAGEAADPGYGPPTATGGSGGSGGGGAPLVLHDNPLTRLNRTEYNNTVHDLLGDNSKPASAF